MVGVGIKQPCPSTKSWMYYPEANCPFYRATYLSNYSPYMTPDNKTHYSLLCETSYSEFKPVDGKTIVDDTIQGLINSGMIKEQDKHDIVDTWVYHADFSYPTPSVERDGILAQAIPFLESHGIYSRGRFGMWKYEVSNTDHTLMQGVELVNRWLLDEPETTIGIKYESTLDGRQAANRRQRRPEEGEGTGRRRHSPELVEGRCQELARTHGFPSSRQARDERDEVRQIGRSRRQGRGSRVRRRTRRDDPAPNAPAPGIR
jgi:hypothetical protein